MKKACVGCGKQIPEAALHCVFCGAKQPSGPSVQDASEDAPASGETPVAAPPPSASKTGVTLFNLSVAEIERETADPAPSPPGVDQATPVRGLPVIVEDPTPVERRRADPPTMPPYSHLSRALLGVSGVVLLVLFHLPWRGSTSWRLIETLTGVDFVRQLYYLAGGAVLLLTAILPVPLPFRALIGAAVGGVPLVLGLSSMLSGWHGIFAAIAVIALPATHLLRAPRGAAFDGLGRGAVLVAALAVGSVYLLPISSVMPVVYLARLLGSMSVTHTVLGLFLGIPLLLAALSLLGSLGRDLGSVAVLLSLLILLWPPAAVLIFFTDGTQFMVGTAILLTSTSSALCTAQLLSLFALGGRPRQHP